jgi:hypothetical protein
MNMKALVIVTSVLASMVASQAHAAMYSLVWNVGFGTQKPMALYQSYDECAREASRRNNGLLVGRYDCVQ